VRKLRQDTPSRSTFYSRAEFGGLGIANEDQFAAHVEDVVNNPSSVRYFKDGRIAYYRRTALTVVIRNGLTGEGTHFNRRTGLSISRRCP
jgi:hypothetical protein